jgi:hypothetical protein
LKGPGRKNALFCQFAGEEVEPPILRGENWAA